MSDFRFDPISFIAGFASGSFLAFILYRLRNWLARMRRQAAEQAESARRFATRTADARYQIDMLRHSQRYHLFGNRINLTEVVVEPRFIIGVETYDTTGERLMQDVFHVVPQIHEFPAGFAPYNVKSIGVKDLGVGEQRLALLGLPGSGRSTALATIALWALGEIEFQDVADTVQQAIDEEEAQLSDQERDLRAKARAEIQERALAQIAHAQEQAAEALGDEEKALSRVDFHRLMPILVHLDDVVVDPETPKAIDPAEPLVRAIQHTVRRITALTVPRYVYNRLNSGQALVLLDGLDELPAQEQSSKLAWLRRFMETYPHCTVIVAGPATGYYPLLQLGLTPLFMRPWTDTMAQELTEAWAGIWPKFAGAKRNLAEPPSERAMRLATTENRGLTPLELLLRLMVAFADDSRSAGPLEWFNDFIATRFRMKEIEGNETLTEEALYTIAQLAARIQTGGALDTEQIHEHVENAMRRVEGEGKQAKENFAIDVDRFVKTLIVSSGLMVSRIGDRYDFVHPLLRAFLASTTIVGLDSPTPIETIVADPAWKDCIPFAVAMAPAEIANKAVVSRLSQTPDLLFSNLFDLTHWLPYAPANAPWRGEVFKRLAAALIAPTQFPILRERAMAALVSSRDKSILFIFRQALRSADTQVRLLGCIGLGALGETDAIKDLRPMLEDDALDVQLAAGLALGAIGSEKALEVMVDGLLHGEESLRQAVSEALAAIPGEGHQILHAAITSEDMMVRRAAVFGLARLGTPWALTDLYRALLEDSQWYVRSAAEQAFARAQRRADVVVAAHPAVRDLAWVVDWAVENAKLPPPAPPGAENAEEAEGGDPYNPDLLVKMLSAGDQAYRIASARTLGYLAYVRALPYLYRTLGDTSDQVRAAAFAALADYQDRTGESLPAAV